VPGATIGGAEQAVLIVNPRSGGGKAAHRDIARECAARGIEPILLGPDDDIADIAARAVAAGAGVLGAAGGDGSQGTVAAIAAAHGVPFVCVPTGTRNHFALDLRVDPRDPVGALDAFTTGREHRIDLGRVNDHMFVNNVSMGWYGKLVESDAYRDAKLKTALEMLPDLVGPRADLFDLRFSRPGGDQCRGAHLLLVSNNPYDLIRPPRQRTRRRLDQGALGMIAVRIGRVPEPRGLMNWTAANFRVDSPDTVHLGLDGEALSIEPPLLFETVPLALRVLLPRGVDAAHDPV
jgi:diacylglycerol kinase family enzyme